MSNNIRIFGSMLVATLGAGLFLMSNNPAHADNVVNDVAVESVDNNSPYGTLDNETIASGEH